MPLGVEPGRALFAAAFVLCSCGRVGYDRLRADGSVSPVDGSSDAATAGDSAASDTGTPGLDAPMSDGGTFIPVGATRLAAGTGFTCLRRTDGTLDCWGRDTDGQNGNGPGDTPSDVPAPTVITDVAIVAAGDHHACAVVAGGLPYCWGNNDLGQLGLTAASGDEQVPRPIDTSMVVGAAEFVALSGGNILTCGLTLEGRPHCWGYGLAGDGESGATHLPRPTDVGAVSGTGTFRQVEAGAFHACGLTVEGLVFCWGPDFHGQLGDGGALMESTVPVAVDTSLMTGATTFESIVSGHEHTCGIATDGVAYCWGYGGLGSLGTGDGVDASRPTPVDASAAGGAFERLFAGAGYHTCGITPGGEAYCWGPDDQGQIGNVGVDSDANVPVPVVTSGIDGARTFVELALGLTHTCGITTDGMLYCWGENDSGQLGTGGVPAKAEVPTLVGPAD